jgi:hypothetical protein
MKVMSVLAALYFATCSLTVAQTSTGSSAGPTGAAGASGSTLSNGSTISGTGGSPGPNALNRGTMGNNMGAPQSSVSPAGPASHGNAVDTPAANAAIQNLGNPDTGILKK